MRATKLFAMMAEYFIIIDPIEYSEFYVIKMLGVHLHHVKKARRSQAHVIVLTSQQVRARYKAKYALNWSTWL
jgi:hypothetical protein